MKLKIWSNDTLAAANNTVNGFGHVSPGNMAFDTMVKDGLISKETGDPIDGELGKALYIEVNRRIKEDTFN